MKVGGRQNNTTTTQDVHILGFTRDVTDVIKIKELEFGKIILDYPGSCKFLKVEEGDRSGWGDETEEAGEVQNMKGMQSIVAALKMEEAMIQGMQLPTGGWEQPLADNCREHFNPKTAGK